MLLQQKEHCHASAAVARFVETICCLIVVVGVVHLPSGAIVSNITDATNALAIMQFNRSCHKNKRRVIQDEIQSGLATPTRWSQVSGPTTPSTSIRLAA